MKRTGRLLVMGKNCAAMNMAIDESIMKAQFNNPMPTLRFYDWKSPAYSFGYFQDIASEVDVDLCFSNGIELVKRMTGGGTVIHGWDLTYTLILPRESNELPVSDIYHLLGQYLKLAFSKMKISTEINSSKTESSTLNNCLINIAENDVICDGNKVAGVSVRRNRNGFLFQGYISLNIPPESMYRKASRDPIIQEKLIDESAAINKNGRYIQREELTTVISETFDFDIEFFLDELTEQEYKIADDLANSKYNTNAWNFKKSTGTLFNG